MVLMGDTNCHPYFVSTILIICCLIFAGGHTITGCTMTIDASSGVISLTSNLDYETETSCTVTVEARDAGSPSLTGTATVLITVSPVNEFTPAFTGAPYTTNIPENTAIGMRYNSLCSDAKMQNELSSINLNMPSIAYSQI